MSIDIIIFYGLCLTFFLVPIGTSPAVIVGLSTLALWVFSGKIITQRNRWLGQKWFLPVISFVAIHLIGLLYTSDVSNGLRYAERTYYWLYVMCLSSVDFKKYSPRVPIKFFLMGLSVTAGLSLLQFLKLVPLIQYYQTGFIGYIQLSLFLVFGMLMLSFYFGEAKGVKDKSFIALLIIIYYLILINIPGRSGYISFILLLPLIGMNIMKGNFLKGMAIVAAIAVIIYMLIPSQLVSQRAKYAVKGVEDYLKTGDTKASSGIRLYMWKNALNIFLAHPLLGAGTGGYAEEMEKYRPADMDPKYGRFTHPHNSILYMAANFGILGVASILWLFYILINYGWRTRGNIAGFAILSYCLVLFIGGLSDTQIMEIHTAMLWTLITGLYGAAEVLKGS